jgi:hypothetical protein
VAIRHEEFKKCLFERVQIPKKFVTFRSKSHVVSTIEIEKVALDCKDSKCFTLPDNITTLPYGHIDTGNVYNAAGAGLTY